MEEDVSRLQNEMDPGPEAAHNARLLSMAGNLRAGSAQEGGSPTTVIIQLKPPLPCGMGYFRLTETN